MKVNCVIVTYNRVILLKECISALKKQTFEINNIYIINNNSTDGTNNYLQELISDPQIITINLHQNIGGAGGFSEGIKRAVLDGCDWVWIMDDDTIPMENALEELVKGTAVAKNVGYVCSRVIWTDGMIHKMNIPRFDFHNKQHLPINYYSNLADVLLIRAASFVSLLINQKAVYEIGLPIKEFFIWGDDTEFTTRIYQHGYICLYAGQSTVVHKTTENYISQLQTAPTEASWKFQYGFRNDMFLRRTTKKNLLFFISAINAYRKAVRHINKRSGNDKKIFLKVIRKAFWEGFFFKPKIEYLPQKENPPKHLC